MARRLTKVVGVVALLVLASSSVNAKSDSNMAVSRGLLQEDDVQPLEQARAEDPLEGSAAADGIRGRVSEYQLRLSSREQVPAEDPVDGGDVVVQAEAPADDDGDVVVEGVEGKPRKPANKPLRRPIVQPRPPAKKKPAAPAPTPMPNLALVKVQAQIKSILDAQAKLKAAGKPVPVDPKLALLQAAEKKLVAATKAKAAKAKTPAGAAKAKTPAGAAKKPATTAKRDPALVKVQAQIKAILAERKKQQEAVPVDPNLAPLQAEEKKLLAAAKADTKSRLSPTAARSKAMAGKKKRPLVKGAEGDDGDDTDAVVEDSDETPAEDIVEAPQDSNTDDGSESSQPDASDSWVYAPVAACGALVAVFAAGVVVYRRRARAAYASLLEESAPAQAYQAL